MLLLILVKKDHPATLTVHRIESKREKERQGSGERCMFEEEENLKKMEKRERSVLRVKMKRKKDKGKKGLE